jgi:hypothetical protein
MKTKTIESLRRWLRAKGFDPGPMDGIEGPLAFAAWSAPQAFDVPFHVLSPKKPIARKGSAQTTTDL